MTILGIESSCDETAVALVRDGRVLTNLVASQHDVHMRFGGVVPELASRRHLEMIVPLLRGALQEAGLPLSDVRGVAATYAPGLIGALLVGLSTAKAIALAQNVPFIGVNHLEGHINAAFIEHPDIPYPHVVLVVSGGHTSLYEAKKFGVYRLLGATRDDAAGEAFDKVAKLIGLGFPGGPLIDRLAPEGDPHAFRFPIPRFQGESTLDFSFSGIKTAVMLTKRKAPSDRKTMANLAASFQRTVVDVLLERLFQAVARTNAKAVIISGGVAANRLLRARAQAEAQARGLPCFIPSLPLCTDNAAMIAFVGEKYLQRGVRSDLTLNAIANAEVGL